MLRYRLGLFVAVVVTSFTLVQTAETRPFRVDQVPNNEWSCNLCHTSGGGTPRNPFGQQIEANLDGSDADWQAVYDLDADGDGFTNGEELADPNGEWSAGDPDPSGDVWNPADSSSKPEETGGDTGMGSTDTGVEDTSEGEDTGVEDTWEEEEDTWEDEEDTWEDDQSDTGTGGGDEDTSTGSDDDDAGSVADTGSGGGGYNTSSTDNDTEAGCSAADGRPVGGIWLALIVGLVALRRRQT